MTTVKTGPNQLKTKQKAIWYATCMKNKMGATVEFGSIGTNHCLCFFCYVYSWIEFAMTEQAVNER